MPSGLMQLVFQGAEDLYLTGNPSITFFKTKYHKYTAYSNEYIEMYFGSNLSFSQSTQTVLTCKIDRVADLLSDIYLVFDLPAIYTNNQIPFGWTEEIGTLLIDEITIRADGIQLCRLQGNYIKVFSDLTYNGTTKAKFINMVGGQPYMYNSGQSLSSNITDQNIAINAQKLYVPIPFWFCQNSGMSLPLIAIQNNEIYIDVRFAPLNTLYRIGSPLVSPSYLFSNSIELSDQNKEIYNYLSSKGYNQNTALNYFTKNAWPQYSYFLCNYIYLGDDERKFFAAQSHEYLMTQVQSRYFQGITQGSNLVNLNLYHPVYEMIWYLTRDDLENYNTWYNFTGFLNSGAIEYIINNNLNYNNSAFYQPLLQYIATNDTTQLNTFKDETVNKLSVEGSMNYFTTGIPIMERARFIFNNNDRSCDYDEKFYNVVQPYKYHSGFGKQGLYCYSFSLHPEEIQPSGSINMSRLTKQQLLFKVYDTYPANQSFNMNLFALNYNVLRIMGGMVAVAFAS